VSSDFLTYMPMQTSVIGAILHLDTRLLCSVAHNITPYNFVLASGSMGHNPVAMATKWIDLITLLS